MPKLLSLSTLHKKTLSTVVGASSITLAGLLATFPACAADQHAHGQAKDVAAFHTALAPLWHAPKGAARLEAACKQSASLNSLAQDIKSSDAAALQEVAGMFKDKCQNSPAEAQVLFGKLHDAFHKLSAHKD